LPYEITIEKACKANHNRRQTLIMKIEGV
jgi:hypothetical protein